MLPSVIIVSISLVLIIISILLFPKLKIGKFEISTYWLISLLAAALLLIFNLAPIEMVGDALVDNESPINPLKILVLFFSMTFISIFLEKAGLFSYLAERASLKFKNSQLGIFIVFYCLISLLTVFTSNDIVILTFTPFLCYFCKNSKINPLPYLVMEFVAANTWSMMLIIGNPTNMYLGTYANIDFVQYFLKMAIPTLAAGIVEFAILYLLFRRPLKQKMVVEMEEQNYLKSKLDVIVGLTILFICLIFLVISSYIDVEMYLVSLISAVALLIYYIVISIVRKSTFLETISLFKKLPYALIPFVLSMFVIVICLVHQGIAGNIAEALDGSYSIWTYGYSSLGVANLTNNIPMSILYSSVLSSHESAYHAQAVYASIIGSNIGAFITPLGALAGIMFTSLLKQFDVKYSFMKFTIFGLLIGIPTISVALGALQLMFL